MNIDEIEIIPIAGESMGVRSMCTMIQTPSVSILLDPSAALAFRQGKEPHPEEYSALQSSLKRIHDAANRADIVTVSHYHFDHVRPGFTNYRYNFSSKEEFQELFENKTVLAKDNRDNINPSQRRRGYYFERDVRKIVNELHWADGSTFEFGDTRITFSSVLPHGPADTPLGFIIGCTIQHADNRVLFAPDVQGPVVDETLRYILSSNSDLTIIGGPPIYLASFSSEHAHTAISALRKLGERVPRLIVDHHLLRSPNWREWLSPIESLAQEHGNELMCMAEMAGMLPRPLESQRADLYASSPPTVEFVDWTQATDEYKMKHKPPLD
ncbi:MAG: MBL fold metallo-hydrolase [Candidatus Thorarchaeota archaeon]|nr:MAG: MBL fold metallo-hydrolase [Candidatus Thorarchaeota archaeon]